MSTILKALKRIDHSAPPPEDQHSHSLRIDTKATLKARVSKILLYRKLYLSLIVLLAVIAAGWLVWSQKHLFISKLSPGRTSERAPVYQAKIYPNPNPSEDPAKDSAAPTGRQNIRIGTNAEKDPAGVGMSSKPLPQMPVQQKNQKKPIFASSGKTEPSGKASPAKPKIPQSQMSDTQKAVQTKPLQSAAASTEKTQAPSTQAPRSYERLDDDKLKLQAIAWSNEAAQRIAVINGHVVREGESVEGFSVDQIRREDVIVNDGTESWQLEFKLK